MHSLISTRLLTCDMFGESDSHSVESYRIFISISPSSPEKSVRKAPKAFEVVSAHGVLETLVNYNS